MRPYETPKPGHVVALPVLPGCDLCGDGTPAHYDAATVMGPWAYLCEEHYTSHAASKTTGVGKGQRLVLAQDPDPTGGER